VSSSIRIIGVAGGSGSGKTTLAARLVRELGTSQAALIAQDSYYIDQSARFDGDGGSVNFDHPSSIDFDLLARHLGELAEGRAIEVPIYDFATHTRKKETQPFASRPIVVVEGTMILSQPQVVARLDASVFIQTSEKARFERRLRRDVQERGRQPEGVRKQFDLQVKPMHDEFVEPSARQATVIVSGEGSLEEELSIALRLARA